MTTAGIVDVVQRARAHVCHGVHMGDIGGCKFCHLSCTFPFTFAFTFTFTLHLGRRQSVTFSPVVLPCALRLGAWVEKKESRQTTQTRDRGGGQGPRAGQKKKENRQPKGGMGGRYAATAQGF